MFFASNLAIKNKNHILCWERIFFFFTMTAISLINLMLRISNILHSDIRMRKHYENCCTDLPKFARQLGLLWNIRLILSINPRIPQKVLRLIQKELEKQYSFSLFFFNLPLEINNMIQKCLRIPTSSQKKVALWSSKNISIARMMSSLFPKSRTRRRG